MYRSLSCLILLAFATAAAAVDEFVPYNDGRLGGCYKTEGGQLYNCTRDAAPARRGETTADADEAQHTREELQALRAELEQLKRKQAEAEARRALARQRREQTLLEAEAAERADEDAAMQAFNAIEAAKDSERLRQLQEKTEACRASLEKRGFRIVGPGACRAPDESYVNCPEC
jgi:hypothetical protein